MTIYVCLYIFLLMFLFIEKNLDTGKKLAFLSVTFVLICIVGLRKENMGYDLPGYLESFDYLANLPLLDAIFMEPYLNYEKGYVIYNSLFGFISTNQNAFLFSCALLSLLPVGIYIYKNSSNFTLSTIIYLSLPPFLVIFSALRQGIAIGICLLSFEFVKKRKLIPFLIVVGIASTIHLSAMFFLVVYPLYRLKVSRRGRWFSLLLLALTYVVKLPLYMYLGSFLKSELFIDDNGAITLMLIFIMIYIFCFLLSKNTEQENGLLNIFWLACFCQMFGSINAIAIRMGYYFMFALVPLLPMLLHNFANKYEKLSWELVLSLCFIAAGLFFIYNSDWEQAYPHFWFWD